jgi:hypothetical protein
MTVRLEDVSSAADHHAHLKAVLRHVGADPSDAVVDRMVAGNEKTEFARDQVTSASFYMPSGAGATAALRAAAQPHAPSDLNLTTATAGMTKNGRNNHNALRLAQMRAQFTPVKPKWPDTMPHDMRALFRGSKEAQRLLVHFGYARADEAWWSEGDPPARHEAKGGALPAADEDGVLTARDRG